MAYLYVVTPEKEFLRFKGTASNDGTFTFMHPFLKRNVIVNVSNEAGVLYCDRIWLHDKDDDLANNYFAKHPSANREILLQKDLPVKGNIFYKCNQKKCVNCTASLGQCTNTMNIKFAKNPEFLRRFVFDFTFGNYIEVDLNKGE